MAPNLLARVVRDVERLVSLVVVVDARDHSGAARWMEHARACATIGVRRRSKPMEHGDGACRYSMLLCDIRRAAWSCHAMRHGMPGADVAIPDGSSGSTSASFSSLAMRSFSADVRE
jgi:hypothetical protein